MLLCFYSSSNAVIQLNIKLGVIKTNENIFIFVLLFTIHGSLEKFSQCQAPTNSGQSRWTFCVKKDKNMRGKLSRWANLDLGMVECLRSIVPACVLRSIFFLVNQVGGKYEEEKVSGREICALANLGPGLEHIPTQISERKKQVKIYRNYFHGKGLRAGVGSTYPVR